MSFNGSGTYSPPTPEYPAIANTVIYASDFNEIISDMSSALSLVLVRDGQAAMTGPLDFGAQKGINLADPVADQDASTKAYADDVAAAALASALLVTADRSWSGYKITNLGTPTVSTDAANKSYVDGVAFNAALPSQTGNSGKYVTTDGTNASWVALSFPYLKVSDQKASGSWGGASVAADITQVRDLTTVEVNTITGASLASSTVTLPAGTYRYHGRAPHYNGTSHQVFLYNSTDAAYVGVGSNAQSISGAATGQTDSIVSGQFTIAAVKDFKLRHYTTTATATFGLGVRMNIGQLEVYSELEFWKIA